MKVALATIIISLLLNVLFFLVYFLPKLNKDWLVNFPDRQTVSNQQINSTKEYEINASFADLGPKMLSLGVINLTKFRQLYQRIGKPLTDEQLVILTKGSKQRIKISSQNAYFLLNFFWALGLTNKNKVLTQGAMTKYGQDKIATFASTGGWSLGDSDAMDYYAKKELIFLSQKQQSLLEQVSSNTYRPCCNNPTSFPDCNHGMALLGVLELMVANGASEKEMYEAAKYFNAFWFKRSVSCGV